MSDYVADQIGQHAAEVASAAPGSAVEAPVSGTGVTSVDVGALAAQIAALQHRIDEADRVQAGNPLADTVKTLQHFLGGHGDAYAVELGNDLAAAVDEADKSGDTSRVSQIAAKLDRHLSRNRPVPGENYHFNNAQAFTADLPDLIDSFKPSGQPVSQAPAKVVSGSVIG